METQADQANATLKESNEDRKRDKHRRRIIRAHEWRVQVWAQMELKIKADQAALEVLGGEPVDIWEPDFSSPEQVAHYASMTLSK